MSESEKEDAALVIAIKFQLRGVSSLDILVPMSLVHAQQCKYP